MPFSEIPNPTPKSGTYNLSVTAAVPESGMEFVTFDVTPNFQPGGGDPNWDVLDAWFQVLVDHMAELPGITAISAGKQVGFGLIVTPTEEQE